MEDWNQTDGEFKMAFMKKTEQPIRKFRNSVSSGIKLMHRKSTLPNRLIL